jgi:hypothetical protein
VLLLASPAESIAGVQGRLLASEEDSARRAHVEQRLPQVRNSLRKQPRRDWGFALRVIAAAVP